MFMKRPTLKALAEQNGYSRRTLFRVLRGDPCVKPETREMLIRLLNIHGYMIENRTATEKIVVDVSIDNLYAERLADKVLKRLKLENYRIVKTTSCSHPAELRKELEDADAVIFSGDKGDMSRIARDINPAIYRIGLFCPDSHETELNIVADNLGGTGSGGFSLPQIWTHRGLSEHAANGFGGARSNFLRTRRRILSAGPLRLGPLPG